MYGSKKAGHFYHYFLKIFSLDDLQLISHNISPLLILFSSDLYKSERSIETRYVTFENGTCNRDSTVSFCRNKIFKELTLFHIFAFLPGSFFINPLQELCCHCVSYKSFFFSFTLSCHHQRITSRRKTIHK